MKRKPDPLLVLAVIVVIGMLSSSIFFGEKNTSVTEGIMPLAVAQTQSR